MMDRVRPLKPGWLSSFGLFFQLGPGVLHPTWGGSLVSLAGAARGLLPTPADLVKEVANMNTDIANMEALPDQFGDAQGGPLRRRKTVSFSASRQQMAELC